MDLSNALLLFLIELGVLAPSSSSSSHDDNQHDASASSLSSSSASSAAYGSEKELNDPQQNMKLGVLHDPSPPSELTNRQDHRINGDGITRSDASKKQDIGFLDHRRLSEDRHSDVTSQRHRELESREAYCDALCPSERPEIQDGGDAFKVLIEDCTIKDSCPFSLNYPNVPIGCWNTSAVTDMYKAFLNNNDFNEKINCWDVSNVGNMGNMFSQTGSFNQPIHGWNVAKVNSMAAMFFMAFDFDQPINEWNVAKVNSMAAMFFQALNFDQPINEWNVAKVTDMSHMFNKAYFDQPLDAWNVAKVADMSYMFVKAYKFNQPLDAWNVAKVTDMAFMFYRAYDFDQPLDDWNVAKVTSMRSMFLNAGTFNQCISSWAEKTSSTQTNFMLAGTDCPISKSTPDSDVGPWCRDYDCPTSSPTMSLAPTSAPTTSLAPTSAPTTTKVPTSAPTSVPTSAPTASPTGACDNSAVFDCAKHVTGFKKRKCSKKIRKKWGVGLKFKDVCREMCKGQLCTCVDSVEKFSIKGVKGDHTCAGMIGTTNCKKFTGNGFGVNKICPNQCQNTKKCINQE